MASLILQAKPEEMDTPEKRGVYTVCIVGCGQAGVLQACLFAEAGFKVICLDQDQTVVNRLAKGRPLFQRPETETKLKAHAKTSRLKATTDVKAAIPQSDIIVVAVPARVDSKDRPDYSDLEKACKDVGSNLRRGSLVMLSSVIGVNTTEGSVRELLENTSGLKVGIDLGLAYSPFRTKPDQTLEAVANHERIVAATDKSSLRAASLVLGTLGGKGLRRTENVKAAETAAMLEAVQEGVASALANELALFCEKKGVDYLEACRLMDYSYALRPTLPKLRHDEFQTETSLLLDEATSLNVRLRIPAVASEINEEMVGHVAGLARDALRDCGKTIRRARVTLLGISRTPNMNDIPNETVNKLAETLEAKGAKVSFYDPHFSGEELSEALNRFKRNLNEALEGADCIVVLTGHDQFRHLSLKKLKAMMKAPAAIIDCEGILEPDKIEKEGFTYRGLGRGVWKK